MPTNKIIHINITVNTDRLLEDYPNPSKDQLSPTTVEHKYLYITATDDTGTYTNVANTLSLKITPDDEVRFYAASEYGNMHQPVVLDGLLSRSRERILLHPLSPQTTYPDVATPVPETDGDFKLRVPSPGESFSFAKNIVKRTGTETFWVFFATFDANLNFHGYFHSEIKITASH